jgi:hypothetical protein
MAKSRSGFGGQTRAPAVLPGLGGPPHAASLAESLARAAAGPNVLAPGVLRSPHARQSRRPYRRRQRARPTVALATACA